MLSTLLLVSIAAAPAPAKPAVMVARVEAASPSTPEITEWVKELRAALEARKDEFRMAKKVEEPELVVRVEAVSRTKEGKHALRLGLFRAKRMHEFSYFYEGKVAAHAAILARNLQGIVNQMEAAPTAPSKERRKE